MWAYRVKGVVVPVGRRVCTLGLGAWAGRTCVSWTVRTPQTHPMAIGGPHGRPVGRERALWRNSRTVNAYGVRCGRNSE